MLATIILPGVNTHIPTERHFIFPNTPKIHVLWTRRKAEPPGRNPCKHRENMQSPHWKSGATILSAFSLYSFQWDPWVGAVGVLTFRAQKGVIWQKNLTWLSFCPNTSDCLVITFQSCKIVLHSIVNLCAVLASDEPSNSWMSSDDIFYQVADQLTLPDIQYLLLNHFCTFNTNVCIHMAIKVHVQPNIFNCFFFNCEEIGLCSRETCSVI